MRPEPRPELQNLPPYRSSETSGGRIFLHANENPFPPPPGVVDEIMRRAASLDLNRYPDPNASELVAELASYAGVDPSWLLIGDGANEVLLQSCLAFGGPGRTALVFEPTYRMHYRQARMAGTDVEIAWREPDFTLDVTKALDAIERVRPSVVFVCTPNNPTGTEIAHDDIVAIANATNGLVVVDEAYFEFCGHTLVGRLGALDNVLVTRTLSKAFRLASVRLGYAIANPEILEQLRRVRMPYGQSAFTLLAATVAVKRRTEMLPVVEDIVSERGRVATGLSQVPGVQVYPSGANFLLFRHPDPPGLLAALERDGIVIRDFTYLEGCEGCLRVTIGTPAENDAFLAVVSNHH